LDVVLGDVAHKQELALEELAVHLICLDSEEPAEAAYCLGVEALAGVGPGKGMGKAFVPGFDEGKNVLAELFNSEEVTIFETLAFEDAEPYFHHVQPGGMEGNEVDSDAFVLGLQPLAALSAGLHRWVSHMAEFGHRLTEVLMVMGGQVIGNVVDHSIGREGPDMGGENTAQRVPIMIGDALAIDFAGCRIQESHQVGNAVASVVEVLKDGLARCCRQVRRQTLEGLNTRAFIKTIQVLRRVEIEFDDVFHLGEEIRIGYLKVILAAVRSQHMFQKDSVYSRTTDRTAEDLGMFFEITLCITQ